MPQENNKRITIADDINNWTTFLCVYWFILNQDYETQVSTRLILIIAGHGFLNG